MNKPIHPRKSLAYYEEGILNGDRIVLAKAITIIESSLPSDQELAGNLLEKLLKKSGNSIRIGITGSPGVGKSTFIEAFGKFLTGIGKKIAVLTVDPSSQKTKGSILGDKTRMPELAADANAFIRPSSSGDALGGVANKTRDTMLLCEAAGYEIVLIETVGVGQSEVAVKNMTDFFLLLVLPGSGDELQGIKKGIMEMADLVVITKADGENLPKARQSQAEFINAIHTLYSNSTTWMPKVLTTSSINNQGIDQIYTTITEFIDPKKETGELAKIRSDQSVAHMHDAFYQLLREEVDRNPFLREKLSALEAAVKTQHTSPTQAARSILALVKQDIQNNIS